MKLRYNDYRLPSESEPQQALMLTWPHQNTDWKDYLDEITAVYIAMADAITKQEDLWIVTPQKQIVGQLLAQRLTMEQCQRVRYFDMETNDTWARDHAALTLKCGEEFKYLDFKFNGWGEKFAWQKDNAITKKMAEQQAFSGVVEDYTDFVLEGGSIESDGEGTILTTSFCLLAPHRNQPLTQEEIEQRLKNMLHADRILWLNHGRLLGDDTDGHIDTIVRMAPNDTLLYVACEDKTDEQYGEFKAMEEELKLLRTRKGTPYRLIPLPFPNAIVEDGERLPATYANFVILNGAILCPTYAQPANDAKAMAQLQKAFPDREIIGIDARTVIRQHGSLHCLTMQFPK